MSDFVDKMSETSQAMREIRRRDVAIIGGGAAGLTAQHWCSELGLDAVLFEKNAEFGGQLLRIYNSVSNYPGVIAASGRELRDKILSTIAPGECSLGNEAVSVDLAAKTLIDFKGRKYAARAIIIATGVRRRELNIPGESEFQGRGVLDSGAKNRDDVAGRRVVIVGGGDAALENALILSERAERVFVVHRQGGFRARQAFVYEASRRSNVEMLMDTQLAGIGGEETVEFVDIYDKKQEKRKTLPADAVLIRIGVVPNTEMFRGQVELDDGNYVLAARDCSSSVPGVFAAGDVANPAAPTIAAAVGQGSIAAKAAEAWLAR